MRPFKSRSVLSRPKNTFFFLSLFRCDQKCTINLFIFFLLTCACHPSSNQQPVLSVGTRPALACEGCSFMSPKGHMDGLSDPQIMSRCIDECASWLLPVCLSARA